jgi:23S rRNA (guanine745-N1)-methyltransferase
LHVPLACSVRGCGLALARVERRLVCAHGHAFDLARSGYCNLLQPNDRRSLAAGDSAEQVAARTRLFRRGLDARRVTALLELARCEPGAAILEVGCGPGFALEELARARSASAIGLDLSAHAIDAAAKRAPGLAWIVANADRRLPVLDRSLALVVSITGPKNWPEFRRVLAPGGRAVVAVPSADDLLELRGAVLAEERPLERVESALAVARESFELVDRRAARVRVELDRAGLADLLLATYRGARKREAERAAELESLAVTLADEFLVLAPRS